MDNVHNNVDTAASIRSQHWRLLLVVNVYVAHAQNSFYHFSPLVTCATFSLLEFAAFPVSSNMLTAD